MLFEVLYKKEEIFSRHLRQGGNIFWSEKISKRAALSILLPVGHGLIIELTVETLKRRAKLRHPLQ